MDSFPPTASEAWGPRTERGPVDLREHIAGPDPLAQIALPGIFEEVVAMDGLACQRFGTVVRPEDRARCNHQGGRGTDADPGVEGAGESRLGSSTGKNKNCLNVRCHR